MSGIHIISTGRAVPEHVVTNEDLSRLVDTNDEWISTRTGIKERHFCTEEKNWQLACKAADKAIRRSGIDKKDIGLVIVATFTPDYATPSVACILQKELDLSEDIMAFDINAACSGFLYGLNIVNSMLAEQSIKYALVIGSEQISTRLDMEDRGTCILFGDGAGAAIVEKSDSELISIMGAEGNTEALGCPGQAFKKQHIYMDGKKVFKFAVSTINHVTKEVLEKAELTMEEIDYVVCHQANERIIRSVMKKYPGCEDKFYINIQNYGNTSAASIPIALDEMNERGLLKEGVKVILVGFGAGFTWGGILLQF